MGWDVLDVGRDVGATPENGMDGRKGGMDGGVDGLGRV